MGLHDTSNSDTAKLPIDDLVMDYFSKKTITDQTEKLALARVCSKLEISSEQAELSIKRLSSKNLIRKIYLQGRVGFELTPKGKSVIEVLAKAATARIASQLQEAIRQERKAKLRSSLVNKTKSIEDKWKDCSVPERSLADEFEREAAGFLTTTKEIQARQPFCHMELQNYDQEFSRYKSQIETLIEKNSSLFRDVNNCAKIKSYLPSIVADIDCVNKAISKYEAVAEAALQVGQLKASVCRLRSIQSELESFDKDQLSRFEELLDQLGDNSRLLEILKKPTHEFASIKRDSLEESTTQSPDPECPMKYGHKSEPSVEKCGKCGAKRKSSPVNIG